ncbi:hypothetical protein Tco_0227731 [Tanacetum coccineum]
MIISEHHCSSSKKNSQRSGERDSREAYFHLSVQIAGMDDGQADARDISVLNKRKKKRYVVDDSASE